MKIEMASKAAREPRRQYGLRLSTKLVARAKHLGIEHECALNVIVEEALDDFLMMHEVRKPKRST